MKRLFSILSVATVVFALAGCQEKNVEPFEPENEGSTFELFADIIQTKTTLDGLKVDWDADDVLYMVTPDNSEAWSTAQSFTYDNGKFVTNSTLDEEGEYTINAIYCSQSQSSYHKSTGTTHKLLSTQSQNGRTTTHIQDNDALVGQFGVTIPMVEAASVEMAHIYTMMEVDVKNNTGAEIEIVKFEMTASDADLAGVFTVSFDTPGVTYKSSSSETITVNVTDGTVAQDGSFPVYFVMAPLSDYSGDVTFKVTDASGRTYTKTVTLSGISFEAGNYNKTPYTINTADEAEPCPLPWLEDFSGDISKYILTDGATTTKIYSDDNLAGGTAPELLVSKTNGCFTARIATEGYSDGLTLTFKSNYPDNLEVSSDTEGVTMTKVTSTEYNITFEEQINVFTLTFKNVKSTNNARLDDISLVKGIRKEQNIFFEQSLYRFNLNSEDIDSFTGQLVSGAQTDVIYSSDNQDVATVEENGTVILKNVAGSATITAEAKETELYKAAIATYVITVVDPDAMVVSKDYTFDFGNDEEVGFNSWNSTYKEHTATYSIATVSFAKANKQSSTITDCPVTKGYEIDIVMTDSRAITSVELVLKQWSSKTKTVILSSSMDGGNQFGNALIQSDNFSLSYDEFVAGVNAIRFSFTETENQVGVVSCKITYTEPLN